MGERRHRSWQGCANNISTVGEHSLAKGQAESGPQCGTEDKRDISHSMRHEPPGIARIRGGSKAAAAAVKDQEILLKLETVSGEVERVARRSEPQLRRFQSGAGQSLNCP